MSIFGSIMSKIFGSHEAMTAQPASATLASASGSASQPQNTASPGGGQNIDVEAILTDLSSKNSQQLNWRTSIVDLMKLLNLDSSLHARQELARELHFSGDMNDSAAMNIWLHKQVMHKLEENGGKVPDDLKS